MSIMGPTLILSAPAITVGIGAVVIGPWAPGRDDQQLKFVRRLSRG
jgi:hypothetical protein